MKLQWLTRCLGLLTLASAFGTTACAGPTRARESSASAEARASARRARLSRAEAARQQAELEQKAADPLARAVAEQDAAKEQRASETPSESKADKRDSKVGVQGIEGTLSNFDVRIAMEKQAKAFGKCHEPRARKVPALAGNIEFRIHVLRSGEVSDVNVRVSDLGDRILERCMSEVIEATKFPEPHGGEANVTWNMSLEPRRGRAPEQWEEDRVERVLRKHQGELLETCDAEREGPITVTAYVNKRGKVVAAGVAATKASAQEAFDCIADELRSWPMPKARKGVAKVSFPLKGA
ncbi:MAG: hypothetical protein JWN48_3264 [Myxococcaceae bacterium]|nr:hypothetical protein [Myxococcaceae bacterium]